MEELVDLGVIDGLVLFGTQPGATIGRRQVHPLGPPTAGSLTRRAATSLLRLSGPLGGHVAEMRKRLWAAGLGDEVPEPRYSEGLRNWYRSHGVDLMFYPAPEARAFEAGVPYVMAIHDLQHLLQPEFPEVSAGGEAETREYVFRHGATHASAVLVDSATGKEDALQAYGGFGLSEGAVHVVPFLPSVTTRTRTELLSYELPRPYLFYPAQFWPHKNHGRLVGALELLVREGRDVHLVLSGSHSGRLRTRTYRSAMKESRRRGLTERIRYLGYVAEDQLAALYREAAALVMPTFFGPTNIPVLEAWEFGCPVITSDIRGIREQVGDAGILVDPRSTAAIAAGIRRVLDDDGLRRRIVAAGRRRLGAYTPEDFRDRLADALMAARRRASIDDED